MALTKEECKRAMKQQGLSGKALCMRAGISTYTLSMWLRGYNIPKKETLNKIADALGLDPEPRVAPQKTVLIGPIVPRLSPHLTGAAADVMGVSQEQIRRYIRLGEPWGYVIRADGRKTYYIDRVKFYEQFGVVLEIPRRKEKENEEMDIVSDGEGSGYYSDPFLLRSNGL